jgi:hypothetical protein
MQFPSGLIDENVEIFTHDNKPMALCGEKVNQFASPCLCT